MEIVEQSREAKVAQLDATLVASDRLEALRQKLDDPGVAAALGELLDHADLLALLVSGLDGFIRRSETVSDSLVSGLGELRAGSGITADVIAGIDLAGLAASLATLSRLLVGAAPALERLTHSDLIAPDAVDVVSLAGRALADGHARAERDQVSVTGVRALLRLLKDPDVGRAIGFLGEVAKSLGRELNRTAELSSGAGGAYRTSGS